jgi:hypothetical protein
MWAMLAVEYESGVIEVLKSVDNLKQQVTISGMN